MRRLTRQILSTKYKEWVDGYESRAEVHPKYNSTQGEYYNDVALNLLHSQDGLCAYTEKWLAINPEEYATTKWLNGRYQPKTYILECEGSLDHFDATLKSKTKAIVGIKDWLWENFFMVDSKVNNKKGDKRVFAFFNPTHTDYSPEKYLAYDYTFHRFVVKPDLSGDLVKNVEEMIATLGLNLGTIINRRRELLDPIIGKSSIDSDIWNEPVKEFITAFKMTREHLQTPQN